MDDQKKELSVTMWTDTKKLAVWKSDISATIWNESTKALDKNQIPLSLDKREKEVVNKRASDN